MPAGFNELCKLGYDVVDEIGEGERILPHAVAQKFETSSSGALVPATEGSTTPVTMNVTSAGIVKVQRYAFTMV